ncbi:MAG: BamA/TamA family outer membrane protein [Rikenellaceae bacterium]
MRKIDRFVVSTILLCTILVWQKANSQETNNEVVNIVEVADAVNDIVNIKEKTKRDIKKEERDNRNLRFSVLGGPGYTPDYGFLVGGSALVTFDMPGMKGIGKRSVLPFAFSLTFGDEIYFSAIMRPQFYLNRDKIRINGEFKYTNLENNYYGVGFDLNKATIRAEDVTQYFYNQVVVNPTLSFRIKDSDWFVGATFHLQRDNITNPAQGMIDDPDYIKVGGDANGFIALNSGVGFTVNYDSRDIPSNAYEGNYFDFKGVTYGDYFGGDSKFTTLQFKYRQYIPLSKTKVGRTLAWSVTSDNVFGDAPFTMLATIGSPFDLRGYYQGQYRDKSAHTAIVEYRHKFHAEPTNFLTKMVGKMGFVAWMGSGMLGPSPFDIEGVLPNYGAGLRFEVQPRMNFRVDVGRSPIEKQTLFYINMTEAF